MYKHYHIAQTNAATINIWAQTTLNVIRLATKAKPKSIDIFFQSYIDKIRCY